MPLFLSVPEFLSHQADATSLLESLRQPWTIPLIDTTGRSHGYRQGVNLRPDLDMLIDDYTLHEDLIVEIRNGRETDEPESVVEMSFMLSGHNHKQEVKAQHNFLDVKWNNNKNTGSVQFHWHPGERVLKFDIHIASGLFESLVGEEMKILPSQIRQLVQSSQPMQEEFRQVNATTAPMRSAIQQILHCPYQGLTRWLYCESKVLELIALRLDQVSKPQWNKCLSAEDVDRIYLASDILLKCHADPPSQSELSRLTGLNDRKLKEGFRQVFGTTVFGCLTQYRMEKACQLLNQQQSVAAVATAVGYASSTSFSGAFRKRFGMSPKGYQLERCRRHS